MPTQHVNAKLFELTKQFPQNEVVINSTADFTIQDATTITLEDNTVYTPGASISTSKRFIVGSNVSIFSQGIGESILWEYTGTGSMFTGVDVVFFQVFGFSIRCVNALEAFTFSDTTPKTSIIAIFNFTFSPASSSVIAALKFGTFTDIRTLLIEDSAAASPLGIDDGITLAGTSMGLLSIGKLALFSSSATYIGLDLGNVVVDTAFEVTNLVNINLSAGSIGISGLTSSGNVGTSIVGIIRDCEFIGSLTPLSGVSESDLRLEFSNCPPVPDSTKTADTFLTSSETVTISVAGTFVAINGVNWSSDITERFTTTTAGIATYESPVSTKSLVIITATVEKVGGGSDEIQLSVFINGAISNKTISATENNSPTTVNSAGIFTLDTNDTIQAFVANIDTTSNVIVSRAVVNIVNGF